MSTSGWPQHFEWGNSEGMIYASKTFGCGDSHKVWYTQLKPFLPCETLIYQLFQYTNLYLPRWIPTLKATRNIKQNLIFTKRILGHLIYIQICYTDEPSNNRQVWTDFACPLLGCVRRFDAFNYISQYGLETVTSSILIIVPNTSSYDVFALFCHR